MKQSVQVSKERRRGHVDSHVESDLQSVFF